MVKSSGVEKGNYLLECKFASWHPLLPLEAPLCVPLRLSPFGKRSAFHSSRCWYLILVQVVRCKLGCVHARPQACLLVIPDDEIILTQNVLSLLQKYCSRLISSGVQLITRTLRYYFVSCVVLDLFRIKTILLSVELYPG